jgi:hypothetical protein
MAGEARFTVYAGFRRGRLVLKRGLPTLERAIAFAESVASVRFRNRDPLFVVDDSTRAIAWQGTGSGASAAVPPEAIPPKSPPTSPKLAPERDVVKCVPPASSAPLPSSHPSVARLGVALQSARRAQERCERALNEWIAPLSGGTRHDPLASSAARVHEQGRRLTDAFARSISLLERRIEERRGNDELPSEPRRSD